jgi:hypothetical protein
MRTWQVFDYFSEDETCPIRAWRDAQIPAVSAAFEATVEILATMDEWEPDVPEFEILERNPAHAGLSWIRFEVVLGRTKFQYRAVGRWRKEAREFILLVGLQKSGRTTIPPNALNDASRYLRLLEQRRGGIYEHFEEEEGLAEAGEGQEIP